MQLTIDDQLDADERGERDRWEPTWGRFEALRRSARDRGAAQALVDLATGSVPEIRVGITQGTGLPERT